MDIGADLGYKSNGRMMHALPDFQFVALSSTEPSEPSFQKAL